MTVGDKRYPHRTGSGTGPDAYSAWYVVSLTDLIIFLVLRGRKGGDTFQKRLLCAQATARSEISLTSSSKYKVFPGSIAMDFIFEFAIIG